MTPLPILFSFRQVVTGKNFIAGVCFKGAALVSQDDEGWLASGVYPCGMSAEGSSVEHAIAELRAEINLTLEDSAFAAKGSFEAFKKDVEHLYNQKGVNTLRSFELARESVKSGLAGHDHLPKVKDPAFLLVVEELDVQSSKPTKSEPELAKVA